MGDVDPDDKQIIKQKLKFFLMNKCSSQKTPLTTPPALSVIQERRKQNTKGAKVHILASRDTKRNRIVGTKPTKRKCVKNLISSALVVMQNKILARVTTCSPQSRK
jgi:hypothetical protein